MRNFFYLLLLAVILITIALVVRSGLLWRNNPGRPINAAMREALDKQSPQWSANDEQLILQQYPNAHKLPSGLRYVVRAQGKGNKPVIGSEVIAHYDGRLLDGTPFDSSYKRGIPFTFRVGSGAVIRGWDDAFIDMKAGEKRTLIIPYWLAYGEKGKGSIPPKATLVFEVEMLDWR